MSRKHLRILFIEDCQDDVDLVVADLKRRGYEPVFDRVETREAMLAALNRETWDLIISDYSMPNFDGLAALKLFRETSQDIPFISVSGTIGEEDAVGMMRAGADDYIMKDRLARLAPAIERELAAARIRREQKRMLEAAAHLAALVESSDDAIISKTLDGTVISWNKAAERIYGHAAQEVVGRPISELALAMHPAELMENLGLIQRGETVRRYETVRFRKDGTRVEVSVTISPIKSASGVIIGASAIERDITERKREEAERIRLIDELTTTLAQAKTLRGLLPICSSCKKIRNDEGYWQQVEVYIQEHSEAGFSHGICPDCMHRLYPDFTADQPEG